MNIQKYAKYLSTLFIGLTALSAGMILYYIIIYGVDVPYNDQWEYVGFFDHLFQHKLTFEELFRQHNEYRQFFPNIIYVYLGLLTHWNVRYEMMVIFLLACLVSINIFRLATYTITGEPWKKWMLFFLANLFVFSPMQYENWIFGVQIEYFLPIACVSTGLVIAFASIDARLKLFYCMVLATLSTFSSINGFLCWFVLYPVFYFSGNSNEYFRKFTANYSWIFGTIITLAFYFEGYKKPEAHPSLTIVFTHPLDALQYFLGTLGNTLRVVHKVNFIMVVGGVLIFAFILLLVYIVRHIKDKQLIRVSIPWVMLGLYSILTAAMLTIGRLGFGVLQSLASRYTSFTLYVDVALIFLASIVFHHQARGKRISIVQKIVIGILVGFIIYTKIETYPVAVNELKGYHSTIHHAKAGLLFINYISHQECVNKIYPINPEEIRRTANILDNLGYLRPPLIKTNILQDIEGAESGTADYGTFQNLDILNDSTIVVSGIAMMPNSNEAADAILLTYENAAGKSTLFALDNSDNINWTKTLSMDTLPCNPVLINAWAFDEKACKAYRLKGSHIFNKY